MTEQEWLQATDPEPMLEFLRDKASDRKRRLFAVGCCRRIWNLITDERCRKAVDVSEDYADGAPDFWTLDSAWEQAADAVGRNENGVLNSSPCDVAHSAAAKCAESDLWIHSEFCAAWAPALLAGDPSKDWDEDEDKERDAAYAVECAAQANLLRHIIGNPFRPISLNPAWLTWHDGLLVSMAQRMYDSRDFSDMPVLADALKEAGCTNPDILGHCRSGGDHVRGCWVVDLLLGKS